MGDIVFSSWRGRVAAEKTVIAAAQIRAVALATGDAETLLRLHHPDFRWISDAGDHLDRESYVETYTTGDIRWRRQQITDLHVVIVGDTAVLWCTVEHEMTPHGEQSFKHRMSQTWTRTPDGWRCIEGHAGHRLES
ncbi:MAG: nuclear transport factor 2 family protein [Nocardioides sp.]